MTEAVLPLLVVTTVATAEQARTLARAMVEARLAACAQISAIDSFYRWRGAVEHDAEQRVLFKTTAAAYPQLEAAIRAQHPYDLPAIHAIPTTHAFQPYAEWVGESVDAEAPEVPR